MSRRNKTDRRRGMSLVEAMIAVLFSAAVCAGLFQAGWAARRYAEYARVAAEARSLARERLEETLSHPLDQLAQPSFPWRTDTNASSAGYAIVRTPRICFHAADTSVSTVPDYAELHVDVVFYSPLWKKTVTNTFTTLVSR